jgi:hypothetical protein
MPRCRNIGAAIGLITRGAEQADFCTAVESAEVTASDTSTGFPRVY